MVVGMSAEGVLRANHGSNNKTRDEKDASQASLVVPWQFFTVVDSVELPVSGGPLGSGVSDLDKRFMYYVRASR
jgi:hypothetical protein